MRRVRGWMERRRAAGGRFLGRFIKAKGLELLMRVLDERRHRGVRCSSAEGGERRSESGPPVMASGSDSGGVPHDAFPNTSMRWTFCSRPSQTTARWREQFGRMSD